MQKLQSIQISPTKDQNITLDTRHMLMSVWYNARAIRPSGRPWMEKPSTWKSFVSSSRSIFIYNLSQSEVICNLERQIKIRLSFQSGNPSGKFYHPSENLPIEWKVEWKPTDRVKGRVKTYRSSERLSSEWKILNIRVKKSSRTIRVKDSNIRMDELESEWN